MHDDEASFPIIIRFFLSLGKFQCDERGDSDALRSSDTCRWSGSCNSNNSIGRAASNHSAAASANGQHDGTTTRRHSNRSADRGSERGDSADTHTTDQPTVADDQSANDWRGTAATPCDSDCAHSSGNHSTTATTRWTARRAAVTVVRPFLWPSVDPSKQAQTLKYSSCISKHTDPYD